MILFNLLAMPLEYNFAEQNNLQIERKSLAVVFTAVKFHQYLLETQFGPRADYKSLIT